MIGSFFIFSLHFIPPPSFSLKLYSRFFKASLQTEQHKEVYIFFAVFKDRHQFPFISI